jgi:hypothetical protein
MVVVPLGGEWRVVIICLTVITAKPRLTSPSDMSSAEILRGRWHIRPLWTLEIKNKIGKVIVFYVGFEC